MKTNSKSASRSKVIKNTLYSTVEVSELLGYELAELDYWLLTSGYTRMVTSSITNLTVGRKPSKSMIAKGYAVYIVCAAGKCVYWTDSGVEFIKGNYKMHLIKKFNEYMHLDLSSHK